MTDIIIDAIKDVSMTIGGDEWLVSDLKVELSRAKTPNYTEIIKMVPGNNASVPAPISDLIDREFELRVDNQLISERDTDSEEETLLFKGYLGNISATGQRVYEGIAYDPSQQPFAGINSENGPSNESGSMMNQKIKVKYPYHGYEHFYEKPTGTIYETRTKKASEFVNKIVKYLTIEDNSIIELQEGGITKSGPGGSVTGAYDRDIAFQNQKMPIGEVLNRAAEVTESTFWFDKEGVFHFGVPDPVKHSLHYITDASEGKTTPPYQSVRVVGSGIASKEGWEKQSMTPEKRIVEKWVIAEGLSMSDENKINDNEETIQEIERKIRNADDASEKKKLSEQKSELINETNSLKGRQEVHPRPFDETDATEMPEPVFEYRNAEISTDAQAKSAAKKFLKDIIEQRASGKVTVVGFPEVQPLHAVKMPQANNPDEPNYHEGQPMGGESYGVTKVVHKVNGSDGFITEIHVGGLINSAKIAVSPDELESYSPQTITEQTEQLREFGIGVGGAPDEFDFSGIDRDARERANNN